MVEAKGAKKWTGGRILYSNDQKRQLKLGSEVHHCRVMLHMQCYFKLEIGAAYLLTLLIPSSEHQK